MTVKLTLNSFLNTPELVQTSKLIDIQQSSGKTQKTMALLLEYFFEIAVRSIYSEERTNINCKCAFYRLKTESVASAVYTLNLELEL